MHRIKLALGGPSLVAKASGLSHTTRYLGLSDLDQTTVQPVVPPKTAGRIRRSGGGRKRLTESDPDLLRDLYKLVDPIKGTVWAVQEWRSGVAKKGPT
jgi:hypothetical protein